jgi:nicotinamidase-related amidase
MNEHPLSKHLPLPPHYNPLSVGTVFRVPYQARAKEASEWAERYAIRPAAQDTFRVALIAIDVQNTFCLPDFELFVAGRSGVGAVEDNRRLCEFIYHNLGVITTIVASLDTHRAMQIFHPVYLIDNQGEHPAPHTLVSHEDILQGRWRFNPAVGPSLGISPQAGQQHLIHYTKKLKESGKYELTIWPYHAMLGGIGHALVAAVEEAIFFHTIARNNQATFITKGEYAATENYSIIGPEVLEGPDGQALAAKDQSFFRTVIEHDLIYIAGQAKSHCVAWTIADLLEQIRDYDPDLAHKVCLLEDCTSPVVVPGVVDYTDQAEAAYQGFARAGMRLVASTEPIEP